MPDFKYLTVIFSRWYRYTRLNCNHVLVLSHVNQSNDSTPSVACSDDDGDGVTLFWSKKFLLDQSQFVYNTPKPSSNQSPYIEAPKAPCRRGHDVIVSV
eukprot:scaffold55810_cov49-Cyclotella_meneghiniana.AAC.3